MIEKGEKITQDQNAKAREKKQQKKTFKEKI